MAIQRGGIHGRASGAVGNVVYGAARGRLGKLVTARELVYPSNPQTAAQVLQRNIFKEALYATRHLTATLWQSWFNRSIGQLPGFQSMMSIILNYTNASEEFNTPADTPLGDLHAPATVTSVTGAGLSGDIDCTWTTELGLNGTAADLVHLFYIKKDAEVDKSRKAGIITSVAIRSAGTETASDLDAGQGYSVGYFFEGQGTARGLVSPCKWDYGTSKA